jgi:hypothetical protein
MNTKKLKNIAASIARQTAKKGNSNNDRMAMEYWHTEIWSVIKEADTSEKATDIIPDVSKQRELLIAYSKVINNTDYTYMQTIEKRVDKFLSNL